jgi:ankyrin repeat protein
MPELSHRPLAHFPEDVRPLHQLCREGRLYDVERWIAEGKPLQLTPEAVPKKTRPKTALKIAIETGQHSLVTLLLRNGYRLELERYSPLDLALRSRRWDLFDLLLDFGGDMRSVDVYTVLETYNADLYERFRAAGYDLTERHAMASILGHSTSNRPLFGFAKRHRAEDPRIQRELNIALGDHAKEGNERGVALCLWAGADPHAPALSPDLGIAEDADPEGDEKPFLGWSALEEAARAGHLGILKRLRPDPARDDFDELYEHARNESIVAFLLTMQPPKDLTRILRWHFWWLEDRFPYTSTGYRDTGVIEAIFKCGVRWEERDPERLAGIRRSLSRMSDYHLKSIHRRLERPEICAPETYHELIRTPKMRARLVSLGLYKKPVTEREKRKFEREQRTHAIKRLLQDYDRNVLYEQVWSEPALTVAKGYGVSSVWLGKVCRLLNVPVPPRGYWARVRSGGKGRKPPLPKLRVE